MCRAGRAHLNAGKSYYAQFNVSPLSFILIVTRSGRRRRCGEAMIRDSTATRLAQTGAAIHHHSFKERTQHTPGRAQAVCRRLPPPKHPLLTPATQPFPPLFFPPLSFFFLSNPNHSLNHNTPPYDPPVPFLPI